MSLTSSLRNIRPPSITTVSCLQRTYVSGFKKKRTYPYYSQPGVVEGQSISMKLRKSLGIAKNNFDYGPLTDIPDWSYADGTPSPLSIRETDRFSRRTYMADRVEKMINDVMICKYQYKLGMHLTVDEAHVQPMKAKESYERSTKLPTLSATADDVPQPLNVKKERGVPNYYTLKEGARAAQIPQKMQHRLRVMTADQIRSKLDALEKQ